MSIKVEISEFITPEEKTLVKQQLLGLVKRVCECSEDGAFREYVVLPDVIRILFEYF